MTPARLWSPWARYSNMRLLRLCLERGGIGGYEITPADRLLWTRAGVLPKPKNPWLLAAALREKAEVVGQAERDNANGNRWDDEDFKSVLDNALANALTAQVDVETGEVVGA